MESYHQVDGSNRTLLQKIQNFYGERIVAIKLFITISLIALIACGLLFLINQVDEYVSPTLIVMNCKVWTADINNSEVQSFVVLNDTILFVGSTRDVLRKFTITNDMQIIDCSKNMNYAFIMPGFIDSHIHVYSAGIESTGVDQRGVKSPSEFIDRVRRFMQTVTNPKQWIRGGRWNHLSWGGYPEPNKTWIDPLTRTNPAFLRREDGHMALANSEALRLANITRYTPDVCHIIMQLFIFSSLLVVKLTAMLMAIQQDCFVTKHKIMYLISFHLLPFNKKTK